MRRYLACRMEATLGGMKHISNIVVPLEPRWTNSIGLFLTRLPKEEFRLARGNHGVLQYIGL